MLFKHSAIGVNLAQLLLGILFSNKTWFRFSIFNHNTMSHTVCHMKKVELTTCELWGAPVGL